MSRSLKNIDNPDEFRKNIRLHINNIINNQMNQNTQFRGFSGGRFNSMIGNIVNSKPGCGACGK